MKKNIFKLFMLVFASVFLFSACSVDDNKVDTKEPVKKPLSFKIAVASDTHFFDPSLIVNDGKAFQDFLNTDRKLLAESNAILDNMFDQIIEKKPELLIIPGDLTKDGEKVSHLNFAQKLDRVKEAGIKVLVIPGNHDINNPNAHEFDGDNSSAVDHISPREFMEIYKEFGYDAEAQIEKGPKLSYLFEPLEGLWVIGIDACIYENNIEENYPRTGGKLDEEHVAWIVEKITEGRAQGKEVIAMMHHGLVEHFPKQGEIASDYIIPNYNTIAPRFAEAGLQFIFTGHSHAQDISSLTVGDKDIYDIQTGSSITYPCPFRMVNITEDLFCIKSHDILLNSEITNNKELREFAFDDINESIFGIINVALNSGGDSSSPINQMIGPAAEVLMTMDPSILQPFATEIYTNMCGGDEKGVLSSFIDPDTNEKVLTYDYAKAMLEHTSESFKQIFPLTDLITKDSGPSDNDFKVLLKK